MKRETKSLIEIHREQQKKKNEGNFIGGRQVFNRSQAASKKLFKTVNKDFKNLKSKFIAESSGKFKFK